MKIVLYLMVFLVLIFSVNAGSWCYQETANASSVGDGSCGLNYSGSYSINGIEMMGNEANYTYDGDWNTWGSAAAANTVTVVMNYTKPENATNESKWQVKDGAGTTNLTLLESCWDYNADYLLVKLVVSDTGDMNDWYCYNATDWQIIRDENGGEAYEEAMWWYDDTAIPDSCSYSSGAWSVNASDSCSWSSDVDLGGNDWSITGSGTVVSNNVNFTNVNSLTVEGSILVMNGGSVTIE